MGQIIDAYRWGDLAPGAYVYDATGEPWKLLEAHETFPGVFRAVNQDGSVTILRQDIEKRVRALVPDEEEALHHLATILGARPLEAAVKVGPAPTNNSATARAYLRSHLKLMHGQYLEARVKFDEMVRCHNYCHADAIYNVPHAHRSGVNA